MVRKALLTLVMFGALATPAPADEVKAGALQISAAWARATPKGASTGGAYFKITNTGAAPDRLIGGSTAVSNRFELHEMSMSGSVMKMRALSGGVEIKPGETVEFKPGGYHVMLVGLKQPLQQGQRFKATLVFEKVGKVDVDFNVGGIAATGPEGAMQGMQGMSGDTKMK